MGLTLSEFAAEVREAVGEIVLAADCGRLDQVAALASALSLMAAMVEQSEIADGH